MSDYRYGRYVPYNDRRCHRCDHYLVDHDPVGCPIPRMGQPRTRR